MLDWYFRGFSDEISPWLKYVSPLPKKPSYYMTQYGVNYNPEWPIRVNVDHILGDEENLSRLPAAIRDARNLPLLLETAVEFGAAESGGGTGHRGAPGLPGPGTVSPADLSDGYGEA